MVKILKRKMLNNRQQTNKVHFNVLRRCDTGDGRFGEVQRSKARQQNVSLLFASRSHNRFQCAVLKGDSKR